MREGLTIDRATLRYRLPDSRPELRPRLDRVRERLFAGALENALDREGLIGHEVVCIRALGVALELPAQLDEAALLERWTKALTLAIHERIQTGDPREVVRYGSPLAALIDMGRSLARGDRRRAWAWQSLALCRAEELGTGDADARVFARALLARPQQIVAVLAGLGRTSELAAQWLVGLPLAIWLALADAALRVHGLDGVTRERLRVALTSMAGHAFEVEEAAAIATGESSFGCGDPGVERALVCSPIVGWVAALGRVNAETPAATRSVVAVIELLALLDAAPLVARRLLAGRRPDAVQRLGIATRLAGERARAGARGLPSNRPAPCRGELLDARAHATTEWAGLLFTLAIVRREQLWISLDAIAEAHEIDPRTVLHGFARTLVPERVPANDPAILAFVGLPPDAEPPALALEVYELLTEPRARLIAALERVLPASDHRPDTGEALLRWLVRRFAEVRGEPGWLEVQLRLREVDIDIRRAGLDLDPDWLPELGVVVKFVHV